MYSDRIRDFANEFDIEDLILRYDVDFDVPLRHEYALGILRMVDAFRPVADRGLPELARRVGAHWCDIVRSDLTYDHWAALRMIEASQDDAEALRAAVQNARRVDEFAAYATVRWHDVTGKIRYRLGSYTRARMAFETAVAVAEQHRLWWCLPDLRSNVNRGRYEESRQSGEPAVTKLISDLRAERERILADALYYGVTIGDIDPEARPRHREYLRGYSSVLHNLALALKDLAKREQSREAAEESLAISEESIRVSYVLDDHFRIYQSLNHQALVDEERAHGLFLDLSHGRYPRGQLIARQHLAIRRGGVEGAHELRKLLEEFIVQARANGGTGLDIHVAAYTVDEYAKLVATLPADLDPAVRTELIEDVAEKRFMMAESIRRAVAMPAYKQAYSRTIRPSYLERIANRIASSSTTGPSAVSSAVVGPAEEAFGLVEASSARELLDMLSTAALPQLPSLPSSAEDSSKRDVPAAAETAFEAEGEAGDIAPDLPATPTRSRRDAVRRGTVRRAQGATEEAIRSELARRETEFEEAFLHHPLEAAPQDPEIAHRVRMFTVNNPDTCVVRYFTYGPAQPESLGAFIFRNGDMQHVADIPYRDVERLAKELKTDRAPSKEQCEAIWNVLVGPMWNFIRRPTEPGHLVLIPTDDLFAIPLHLAWEPGTTAPLAARVPTSQSVSATAFVSRGRSFLRRQPVSVDDDLAAIVVADENAMAGRLGVAGGELLHTGWQEDRMVILGDRPAALRGVERHFPADMEGIRQITLAKPEFLIYAGHGGYNPHFRQLGPYLDLRGTYLTQYDLALRLRLPRNKLTILGACLAGLGAKTDSGEVSGFLRSLIATGAGVVGMPLWSVEDGAMVRTVRALLSASRHAVASGAGVFDPVQVLHERYRDLSSRLRHPEVLLEQLPLSLYL
ncbi:CHAT domain-containing protein [Actinoplanes auranticolor]|uniref:CHAT domain-containing protein n=1 Tax=Actinoplanes auranticolor TaxID=47988 RepID=A0A919VTU0_9ACTN|nr:CHAT domain-containing protein [Actinoplanes auranticolor]GIM76346.1 hypothetical protein Aau02nite_70450 [Actinoplanes auranticolor]